MKLTISPEEIQSYVTSFQNDSNKESETDLEYQNSACVLYSFDPTRIFPFNIKTGIKTNKGKDGWTDFFKFCDPVEKKAGGNWWQLRNSCRRKALQRLHNAGKLIEALQSNQDGELNEEQRLYEDVLRKKPIDINNMRRVMLVTLSGIIEWVKDILPGVSIISNQINRAIPMADLLAPMYRLASDFVGRKNELNQLAEYIGIKPPNSRVATRFITQLFRNIEENPPFLIYGPGGVGKSTLLAKFILNNTYNNDRESLLFAYLDIDKAVIDLEWPESFVIEAIRQLSTQSPELGSKFIGIKEELERMRYGYDLEEVSKSYYSSGFAIERFGKIVGSIEKPVMLIIDTFEEAQFLGRDVVQVVWNLLAELQRVTPNLRTIVAGRSLVEEYPVKELKLTELSKEEARELLENGLEKWDNDSKKFSSVIDDIINVAGLNPMSLRLALTIVREQGIDKLKKIETRNLFFMRLRDEVIQARLYGRILSHVHDDEVRKLAYPGLIVRRINPEIILSVLAGPCKLKIQTMAQARDLFDKLTGEGALMSQDPESDALIHRADVRKLMLQDLKSKVPAETIRSIHDLAIKFYSGREDIISRAEEIYHRLSRGDDPKTVDLRWKEGVQPRLRTALEELPVDARIWLSPKLGVTPDSSLLKKAGLEKWEEITARTAQRFLTNGNADQALELMRERPERSPASPLYRLELEALRLLGLYDEALFTVNEALASLPGSSSAEFAIVLLLQAALVNEALNRIDEAIECIKEAEKLLKDPPEDQIAALRILITHVRLLRKKGQTEDIERSVLIKKVMRMVIHDGNKMEEKELNDLIEKKVRFQLNSAVLNSLRSSPALLQELVAELGKVVSQLIPYALDYIGIDLRNETQKSMLAKGFKIWNDELSSFSKSGLGELVERSGIKNNSIDSWLNYINNNTGRTLGSTIYNWQYEILANKEKSQSSYNFDKVLVDISRNNVDLSINKTWE